MIIYNLFSILIFILKYDHSLSYHFSKVPSGCETETALQCEKEFLNCKLFTGPADDASTLCTCGDQFYGDCIRKAGCETSPQVDELSTHEIYMKLCVNHIINNDCPSSLMCSINCASEGTINPLTSKIIPFNNYGIYYLRIRICRKKVHENKLERYSFIDAVACKLETDYDICSRWIPPQTFVPVALPIDTTYIEVDSCVINSDLTEAEDGYYCFTSNPSPSRVYGNAYIFPRTFDVAQTNLSVCSTNDDCLGSFCETKFLPHVCSPKTLRHVQKSGKYYLSDPFG